MGLQSSWPHSFRNRMLSQIHASHLGMVKTKSICRFYIWWPDLDKDIEKLIGACDACILILPSPAKVQTTSWPNTGSPCSRVYIDFAGPFKNLYFLVIVDSFTHEMDWSLSNQGHVCLIYCNEITRIICSFWNTRICSIR